MNFFTFWQKLVFEPRKFFKEDFDGRSSPFLFATIAIYGIAKAMDRVEKQLTKADLKGTLAEHEWINNWSTYWIVVLISGAISGIIFYLLGGWFYNVRIKWSKGTSDKEKARFLFLYPEFVPSLIVVVNTLIFMLGSPVPYDSNADLTPSEIIGMVLVVVALYYSVYISYIGVTTVTDVSIKRAKIWFLILPIVVYSLGMIAILGAIMALVSYQ